MFFAGCAAFALFFLSDLNDLRLHARGLRWLFPAGFLLLAVSAALQCRGSAYPPAVRLAGWCLAAGSAGLELWSLFFALPARDAYARPGEKRAAVTGGVYALCRHPGVLFFAFLMLGLYFAAGLPLLSAAVYTALDVLLVLWEDRRVFPAVLRGYEAYRAAAPFLIPTPASIRACLQRR